MFFEGILIISLIFNQLSAKNKALELSCEMDTVMISGEPLPEVVAEPLFEPEISDYFSTAGVALDSCNYPPLYESSFDWMATPYHFGGNSKKGIDCSALVKRLYAEAYNLEYRGNSRSLYYKCTRLRKKELAEGDLVFFRIDSEVINHVGLYLKDGYFVHASVSRGVHINNLSESYYRRNFFKGGRLRPEEEK